MHRLIKVVTQTLRSGSNLHLNLPINIHKYICVSMYIYTHIYLYICAYILTEVCVCIYMYIFVCPITILKLFSQLNIQVLFYNHLTFSSLQSLWLVTWNALLCLYTHRIPLVTIMPTSTNFVQNPTIVFPCHPGLSHSR